MRLRSLIASLLPDLGTVSVAERLRASFGAMLGLFLTGLISRLALGPSETLPLLIAPMGASAVLLFAVPSSPLAQPWSILGGNIVAAVIGITAARFIPDPIAAAAVGGALAIAAMMVLRCLHPPSGAVALTAVLGGPAVRAAGYSFVFWPVGLNSVLLLAVALAFNNATGRRYPHRPTDQGTKRSNPTEAAVTRVLLRHDELVDLGPHDLSELVEEVESEMTGAEPAAVRCADLMRDEAGSLPTTATLEIALDCMRDTRRTTLPVVDTEGRCVGVVGQGDLLRHLRPTGTGRRSARLFQRSLRFDLPPATLDKAVVRLPVVATADTPVSAVVEALLQSGADYCPVLDRAGTILGAITQADLLRWSASRHATMQDWSPAAQPSSVIQRL